MACYINYFTGFYKMCHFDLLQIYTVYKSKKSTKCVCAANIYMCVFFYV